MTKKILDVCCGSKMFWFDKDRTDTVYMDNRDLEDTHWLIFMKEEQINDF